MGFEGKYAEKLLEKIFLANNTVYVGKMFFSSACVKCLNTTLGTPAGTCAGREFSPVTSFSPEAWFFFFYFILFYFILFYFIFLASLLEYNCFTMVC